MIILHYNRELRILEVFKKTLYNEFCGRIESGESLKLIISDPADKSSARKITVSPIERGYQFARYTKTQVFHENFTDSKAVCEEIRRLMEEYRQIAELPVEKAAHNRQKQYIFAEGEPIPFLVAQGVMTPEGKVKNDYQKKFRQINRFTEFIGDAAKYLPNGASILDFGCGKSYLTFAMYHYLNNIAKKNVRITGLDIKAGVVEDCQRLADKLGFSGLTFLCQRIEDYDNEGQPVDMMVSLHACDTSTDHAIANAIKWNAKVILSVPCCQHELNKQIINPFMDILLSHGILKERFSALLTDGIRAEILKACGYKTTVMEFVDMEHTPKNIMIRAVKTRRASNKPSNELMKLMNEYGINHTLFNLVYGNPSID